MKKVAEHEFGKNFVVYYKNEQYDNYSCVDFETYRIGKDKYEGKDLIIAHKDMPVYFRTG